MSQYGFISHPQFIPLAYTADVVWLIFTLSCMHNVYVVYLFILLSDSVEGPDARKTACYDIDVEVVSSYNDTHNKDGEHFKHYMIGILHLK